MQNVHIARVSERLGNTIVAFCQQRVGQTFHMEELREHVRATGITCAPASPDRILRQLRSEGSVLYTVVSRAKSLYEVEAVAA